MRRDREWLERSPLGQVLLSVVMLVVIACIVLWNLPPGRPHDAVRPVAGAVIQGVGLEQDWALFSPDPRSFDVGVYATLTHRGGRISRWVPPHNGHYLAPYRTYRWQKYVERLRADDNSSMWEPTARWVAAQGGKDVVKVVLTRTFRDVVAPGDSKPRPPTGSYDFFTLDLP